MEIIFKLYFNELCRIVSHYRRPFFSTLLSVLVKLSCTNYALISRKCSFWQKENIECLSNSISIFPVDRFKIHPSSPKNT